MTGKQELDSQALKDIERALNPNRTAHFSMAVAKLVKATPKG